MRTWFQPHDVEYHRNGELQSYAFINNLNAMEVQTDCTNRVVFIKKVIFFLLFYPEKLTPQPHT